MALLSALRGLQNRNSTHLTVGPGIIPQPLHGPVAINQETAMTVTAAWRCVNLVSDSIGSLPLHRYRDGQQIDAGRLLTQPEPGRTRIDTISSITAAALIHGNAYGIVSERDSLGFPVAIVHVSPYAVAVEQNTAGQILYRVGGRRFLPEDVLHVRGYTPAGSLTGLGVLAAQRRTLGQSIAAEDYSGELWTTGATPDAVLKSEVELTPEQAAEYKSAWIAANGGRSRGPAILPPSLEYKPIGWSNVDLEMLESRKWNAVQVCQMFGVQPVLAGVPSGESKTYQNVQQDTALFVKFTLRGWLSRIEASFSQMLPRGNEARFNLDALLRADTLERYQAHQIGLDAGFLTQDEVREIENLPPLEQPPAPLEVVPEPESETA